MANRKVQKVRKSNPKTFTSTGIAINKNGNPQITELGLVNKSFIHLGGEVKVFSLKSVREKSFTGKPYIVKTIYRD